MRRKPREAVRRTLPVSVIFAILAVACACAVADEGASPRSPDTTVRDSLRVLVGTYTGGGSRGIYRLEIDAESGRLVTGPSLAGTSENPSFLAFHPSGKWLYAVNEVASFRGGTTGAVSAFSVDPLSGDLTLLGQQPSQGADPCHLIADGQGRHLLVANYTTGSVAVFPLAADGRIEPASWVRQYTGSGPNEARQRGPHAHAVLMDGAGRFVLSADLGTDRIHVERLDAGTGRLAPNEPDGVLLEPGSGPRHLAWHPNGRVLYAINELRSTVSANRWDEGRGVLTPFQTVAALPAGFGGENTAAEIAVAPDGRFVYASNRGHDSLAVFAADASGMLAPAGWVESGGRTPRSFAVDPSGRWLVVANQGSDSVVVFRLERETGLPYAVGPPIAVPEPVAVVFSPSHATRNEVEP